MPPSTSLTISPKVAPALPSASSALALMNGEPGAFPMVLAHTGLRAGIIAIGLVVSGQRRGVFRNAIVSSLAIEAFVLLWAGYQKSKASGAAVGAPI
jgi:hypothetical protein